MFTVSDGAHGGTDGFYFLPPMVRQPSTSGSFDPALSPVVEICTTTACTDLHHTFTTGSTGSESIRVDPTDEHYIVNWHTDRTGAAAGTTYRIRVRVADLVLGHADVQIVSNGREARNVTSNHLIALVDGRTLPIKFRIETGIPGSITVTPAEATIDRGETQAFTADVRDLRGDLLAGTPIGWTSADEEVATVDAEGLASGLRPGQSTITARVGSVSATAVLTVNDVVARISIDPASASIDRGQTQQFTATLFNPDDQVLTGRTVTWTSANEAVATIDAEGLASGLRPGQSTITARVGSVSASADLEVREVNGLLAEYYHMTTSCGGSCAFPNGTFVASRIESTIDYQAAPFEQPGQWLRSFWPGVVNPELFSVRWSGFVEPQFTENYTFCVNIDDGVRLWIGGALVVDAWVAGPPREVCGSIALRAGQRYALRMEMFQNLERSEARLWWQSPSQRKEIIPSSALFAP